MIRRPVLLGGYNGKRLHGMTVTAIRVRVELPPGPWWLRLWDWLRRRPDAPLRRFARGCVFTLTIKGMPFVIVPLDRFEVQLGQFRVALGMHLFLHATDVFGSTLKWPEGDGRLASTRVDVLLDGRCEYVADGEPEVTE